MAKSKLTPEDKKRVQEMYDTGDFTYPELADIFGVSSRTINRIVNPDLYAREKESIKNYQAVNKKELLHKRSQTYSQISFKLHNTNDKDIIEKLDSVPSVQGYLKDLIRYDIDNNSLEKK